MARRAQARLAQARLDPWDQSCEVRPLIGGYKALTEMRDALEALHTAADKSTAQAGTKGYVYIADWRFNCQRDLSSNNPWGTHAWSFGDHATMDQTATGLILRLMQAGVVVRVLLWLPTWIQVQAADFQGHLEDHFYLANIVHEENKRLQSSLNPTKPLGIVGLDARTADGAISGGHHQKMMLIRSPGTNVAFCGGVDLAFTRRDAPADPDSPYYDVTKNKFLDGDWQSTAGNSLGILRQPN